MTALTPMVVVVVAAVWLADIAAATAYNSIETFPPARVNEVEPDGVEPNFGGAIENVTVALGREAILTCRVDNLGLYKVGWMRADTQTILSLHKKVVTHNTRISVTHQEPNKWNLHIRTVREEDRGCYMCQINTAVMKKNVGCVDVHVPPNIIDEETSGDITVPDGESVYLVCTADGYPEPKILWRREDGDKIMLRAGRGNRSKVDEVEGQWLNLTRVRRKQMGAYVCIARNEVPPAVMKRIIVNVSFEPTIQVPNQLVGTPLGSDLVLKCLVEAYPKPITFWRKDNNMMILDGPKYRLSEASQSYHTNMTLMIRAVAKADIGTYTCVARNSINQDEGQIRTYEIDPPATQRPTPPPQHHTSATAPESSSNNKGIRTPEQQRTNQPESPYQQSIDPPHSQVAKGKRKEMPMVVAVERGKPGKDMSFGNSVYSGSVPSATSAPPPPYCFLLFLSFLLLLSPLSFSPSSPVCCRLC